MPTAKGNLTYLDRLLREGAKLGLPANVAAMSEQAVESAVMEWANQFGWELTYHVRDSRVDRLRKRGGARVDSGWPDRVYAHLKWHRVIVVELKDLLREVTPGQAQWLSAMARAGWEVGVWRPSDLADAWDVLSNKSKLRPPLRSAWRG